jgi:hypothetical protein
MGTRKNNRNIKKVVDCQLCGLAYSPACDYRQGRCPHHPSLVDNIKNSIYYTRFLHLINFLKGMFK